MNSFRLPFFTELRDATNVLVAGAGGGFDVFSGLPLYFNLRAAGKNVHLANLSFSKLPQGSGHAITPYLVEVTADSLSSKYYFPEQHLCQWFRDGGREERVYCFRSVGPKPTAESYQTLCEMLSIDTVILVDGGTDSLMCGDEVGLGTPLEDMSSIAAVDALDPKQVPRKMLVCLGFGVDAFHGVCHAHVLEAIAELIRAGGYLGAFSLMAEMPEVQKAREAIEYVLERTPERKSIVLTSILSALDGRFGNHHATARTVGDELFINPLMSLYWCFRLDPVARRIIYMHGAADVPGYFEFEVHIDRARAALGRPLRSWRDLPM